ncbi:MAG: hypothetical protein AAGC65_25560 [Mucilaginibacter sp.]|uniref:hypothetical protein n=1 Tax=Mucilaginibacter sp. TaxID=1882438 RepID=UPI00319F0EAE
MNLKIEHIRCPLHRYTFSVRPIRKWVERNCEGLVLNLFAGTTKLGINEVRNDLDLNAPADYHLDALEFVRNWTGESFRTILLDPPYALRKSMELYEGRICSPFRQLKDALPRILQPDGIIITFGYHSIVMGSGRNFMPERLCLFSHGGAIHDTIATVERHIITNINHHE